MFKRNKWKWLRKQLLDSKKINYNSNYYEDVIQIVLNDKKYNVTKNTRLFSDETSQKNYNVWLMKDNIWENITPYIKTPKNLYDRLYKKYMILEFKNKMKELEDYIF